MTFTKLDHKIIVTCIMLVCFVLFQPKVSSLIQPIRLYRLYHFIASSEKNQNINMWDFWKLREFYYPGAIEVFGSSTYQIVPSSQPPKLISFIDAVCSPMLYSRFMSKKVVSESYFVSDACPIPTKLDQITKTAREITIHTYRSTADMMLVDGYLSFDMRNKSFAAAHPESTMLTITTFNLH